MKLGAANRGKPELTQCGPSSAALKCPGCQVAVGLQVAGISGWSLFLAT